MITKKLRLLGMMNYCLILLLALSIGCGSLGFSSDSSKLGRYYQGKVLHVSVAEIERSGVISFSTVNPEGIVKNFQILPSSEKREIVRFRIKVENHTAATAIVNIDEKAVVLNDFFSNDFTPINIYDHEILEASDENSVSLTPLWNNLNSLGKSESFVLPRGTGIDGWMFFDVPVNTHFKEFKWRAGDSLGIEF
tara:strand:- start:60 stop:641 length:582 start_codon:yes stop_codon:yes gene_type:complete